MSATTNPTPTNRRGRRCGAALACAALLFVAEDQLRFEPEGSVARAFGETTRWELTSLVELASGTELPAEEFEFTGTASRELELIDTFGPIEDGRPEHLTRSFERAERYVEIELGFQGLEELYEAELESPVVGETVRLEWDPDEDAHVASSETGLDSLHLDRMTEDCDLRALLPESAEEGDEWTVPAAALADVFAPAGRLIFTTDEVPDGPYSALTPVDVAAITFISVADTARELEGEASLTWAETRSEGELSQAVIEIELEVRLAGGLDDDLERLVDDMGAGGKHGTTVDFEWSLEGRGQLIWNLDAQHFQTFELELDGALELEMLWSENDAEVGMLVGLSTQTSLSAECTPE